METSMTQKPLIIFSHFPKTGGTTLHSVIDQEYQQDHIFHLPTQQPLKQTLTQLNNSLENNSQIKIAKGYIGVGLHEFLPQVSSYITMLRNPVKRMVSRYHYLRTFPADSQREVVKLAKNTTLEEFSQKIGDNSMTRFFSGSDFRSLLQLGIDKYSFIDLQTAKVKGNIPNYEEASDEMLEQAKTNLKEHFLVIGLTERYDESLILFSKALAWKKISYIERNVNKKKPKDQLSDFTLDCIKRYNELDVKLYCYAQELFEKQIEQYGSSFKKDLEKFYSLKPIQGKLNALHYSTQMSLNRSINSSKQFVKRLLQIPSQKS